MMSADFEIRESTRATYMRILVHTDGRVVITKPVRVSLKSLERFVDTRRKWIEKMRHKFLARQARRKGPEPLVLPKPRKGSKAYTQARETARTLVTARLNHFNTFYGFKYRTISIRNQKTRWGSCSAAGNLSFNYRLIYLPPELADYVIVHELCHTKEHNHSKAFWDQVGHTLPNYRALRQRLRNDFV